VYGVVFGGATGLGKTDLNREGTPVLREAQIAIFVVLGDAAQRVLIV